MGVEVVGASQSRWRAVAWSGEGIVRGTLRTGRHEGRLAPGAMSCVAQLAACGASGAVRSATGAPGALGDAPRVRRAALRVDGGQEQAPEQAEVLVELGPLQGAAVGVVLAPVAMRGKGGRDEGSG